MSFKRMFLEFILENSIKSVMRKYGISDSDIKKAQKELAKIHKVSTPEKIEFINVWDYGFSPKDSDENYIDLLFNIMDPGHRKEKSTISYPWGPKTRRGDLKESLILGKIF